MEVIPSKPIKIKGCIGNVSSNKTGSINCSKDEQIGEAGTDKWFIGGTDPNATMCFILEIDNNSTKDPKKHAYIQIITHYKHPTGHIR